MHRRTRRALFVLATCIFLLAGYIAILYAQGYKYDIGENTFHRTGAIFIRSNADGDLYLNDELYTSTSFFGNSASIDRLLPGTYTISLRRENFTTWTKEAMVQEGLLTEFSNAMILPTMSEEIEKIKLEISSILYPIVSPSPTMSPTPSGSPKKTPTPLATPTPLNNGDFYIKTNTLYQVQEKGDVVIAVGAKGFALSPNKNKVLWWNNNEISVTWMTETDYQPFHNQGDTLLITKFSKPILKADWFRDNDHFVVDTGGSFTISEIDTRGGLNLIKI